MDFDIQDRLWIAAAQVTEPHSNLYVFDLVDKKLKQVAELDTLIESLTMLDKFSASFIDPALTTVPFTSTEEQTLTATVMNNDGIPLANVTVNIEVKGVNPFTVQGVTDEEGKVTITYKNDSGQAGTDTITVTPQDDPVAPIIQINDEAFDFFPVPATVKWSAGPVINDIKVKGGGKKIILTGLQFQPDDLVFINGQQLPAKVVKFRGEGDILLKLKGQRFEFLAPCAGEGSSNMLKMESTKGETSEATFIACPQ
jgi:hypothetical protein